MKTKYLIGLMVGSVVITAGAMAGGYFLSQLEDEEPDTASQSRSTAQNSGSSLNVVSPNLSAQTGANSLLGGQNQGSPASGSDASSRLLNPSEFGEYEQYSDTEGVLYADIRAGTGTEAAAGDDLAVVYTGYLTDGTIFDQSKENAQGQISALTFKLGAGQVISGWDQGFAGMKSGGTRRLIVPASAAYGEQGQGQIPPNSMLIFDVELVQVTKASNGSAQPGL